MSRDKIALVLYFLFLFCIVAFGILYLLPLAPTYGGTLNGYIFISFLCLFYTAAAYRAYSGETKKQKIVLPLIFCLILGSTIAGVYYVNVIHPQQIDQEIDLRINQLRDSDEDVRARAARTLGDIGDERAVDALITALNDENEDVREDAAEALGNIGDERAVDALAATLKDEEWRVRNAAATALCEIGGDKAFDALITALKDENEDARMHACVALGNIGDERAVDALAATLKDENLMVREDAAEALGKIGGDKAFDALITALKDEDSWVQSEAAEALGKIGDKRAIPALITLLQEPRSKYYLSGERAADALEQLEWQPESEEEMVSFFVAKEDGDELQRIWDQTKRVLLEDLKSTEEPLMKGAVRTFISIGNAEIIPILVDELDAIGNKEMAEIYLNCGHATLESAAESWAWEHGYQVVTRPGGADATWGDW